MKIKFELTTKELMDLGNAIADASRNDVEFCKIKDRRIRKIFREAIEDRHKLWLKIIHIADNQKGKT